MYWEPLMYRAVILALIASRVWAAPAETISTEPLPALPFAVGNNAVAQLDHDGGKLIYSFLGLGLGKTWEDTLSSAAQLDLGQTTWVRLPDVPGPAGRLAATAVGMNGAVYIFGGYTVAADGLEQSIETVHRFDPTKQTYAEMTPMPVPVDDAVSLPYQNRYIYLVSGWHDSGNVNLVQLFDTKTGTWRQATPYPGAAVFGHAGGIVDRTMLICDGVRLIYTTQAERSFGPSAECFLGVIHEADPARIDWREVRPHPGRPLYRMAATGTTQQGGMILFAGGSDNPYNYDGIGYDGNPSQPSADVFAYSLTHNAWIELGELPQATMDHRGLLEIDGRFILVGGMRSGQTVTDEVVRFRLSQ